jgi:hypothetical protein
MHSLILPRARLLAQQHDPAHQPAGHAIDAGQQLGLRGPAIRAHNFPQAGVEIRHDRPSQARNRPGETLFAGAHRKPKLVARSDYLSATSADLRRTADAAWDRARRAIDNDAIAAEMDRTNP